MSDFLEYRSPRQASQDNARDLSLLEQDARNVRALEEIRLELLKVNPDVLATVVVSGTNPIPLADTDFRRVRFEVGGKPVTIYRLVAYSTFSGVAALSVTSMANINDGMVLGTGPITLAMPLSEVYVSTDGTAACPVNLPADLTNGAIVLLPFTIPVFESRLDRIPVYSPET